MAKILLLEDDFKLAAEVQLFLSRQGFQCELVYDGLIFFKQKIKDDYDLYLLDINVPSLNGFDVCKKIREHDATTPILMLTAYGEVEDKVQALTFGADDYLVKPFHLDELCARIKALVRRSQRQNDKPDAIYQLADLVLNSSEMKVSRAGREISLTPKEYKLLELLMKQAGRTLSKQSIAEQVWDLHFETGTNTIEVYISFLRNKIDKGFDTPLIHTRPGYGYYLKETR